MNFVHPDLLMSLIAVLPLLLTPGLAQTQLPPIPAVGNSAPVANPIPVYRPPLRGAPVTRVGGASRGPGEDGLILSVLAPESTGLTSHAHPTLYWYSSKGLMAPLEFTLNDDHSIKPLMELKVPASQPGIHALRLNYTLQPGVEYQWAIAAVADPNQRASDVIASGTIKRVQPSTALVAQLGRASQKELPFVYAREGFWYDAIAVLCGQIDTDPADRQLWEQRAALLAQVGLTTAPGQSAKR